MDFMLRIVLDERDVQLKCQVALNYAMVVSWAMGQERGEDS